MNLVVIKSIVWVGLSFGWEAPFGEGCGASVFTQSLVYPLGTISSCHGGAALRRRDPYERLRYPFARFYQAAVVI